MSRPAPLIPASIAYATDGTPWSAAYADVYHASAGGLGQARHVFLGGNQLPARWQGRERFTILETGFGLGLNFLTTWQAWRDDPQRSARLHFVSTELHPFHASDLHTLHQAWPELAELALELEINWPPLTPGFHHLLLDGGRVTLTLLFGDALHTLPDLVGNADAIYLDGFSPQKNPQLWSAELLTLLSRHAAPGATLASWCVVGAVRQNLSALGWQISRQAGFAHKRHMLNGQFGVATVAPPAQDKHAIVIGAGIAGCSMSETLARRGWRITLIDSHAVPAQEASGNPAGLLHPMLARDDNLAARFSRAAYLYALRSLQRLAAVDSELAWQQCGILQVAENAADANAQQGTCAKLAFPADYVAWVDQPTASLYAGATLAAGGWWFPQGAWVKPQSWCGALLKTAGDKLRTHFNTTVARIEYRDEEWHVYDAAGICIASASHLILANAVAAAELVPELSLTLRAIRGQITYLPVAATPPLKVALCGAAYVIQAPGDATIIGASFVEQDKDAGLRTAEHLENLARMEELLPEFTAPTAPLSGRVSFRAATHDRLPLIGQLPSSKIKPAHTLNSLPRQPGLFALLGLGSRGLIWAPLAAELLGAQISGAPLPVEHSLRKAIDPARFQLKKVRQAG